MTMPVFRARLKTQHLLTTKIQALKQFQTWSSPLAIQTAAKKELFWRLEHLHSWNRQSFLPTPSSVDIYGRLRFGLGHCGGPKLLVGLMDVGRANSVHQPDGASGDMFRYAIAATKRHWKRSKRRQYQPSWCASLSKLWYTMAMGYRSGQELLWIAQPT